MRNPVRTPGQIYGSNPWAVGPINFVLRRHGREAPEPGIAETSGVGLSGRASRTPGQSTSQLGHHSSRTRRETSPPVLFLTTSAGENFVLRPHGRDILLDNTFEAPESEMHHFANTRFFLQKNTILKKDAFFNPWT